VHVTSMSSQKAQLTSQLDTFYARHEAREHVIDAMAELFDELFSNAIFNAPKRNGVASFAKLNRFFSPRTRPISPGWRANSRPQRGQTPLQKIWAFAGAAHDAARSNIGA